MKNEITIAVVSDLHCRYSGGEVLDRTNTYLTSDLIGVADRRHPVRALQNIIREEGLKVDLLLCPGDITDRMDIQGLITGWSHIFTIGDSLKPSVIAATAGNHDIDSRNNHNKATPFEFLKSLSPLFPTNQESLNKDFWSNNFCILEEDDYDLLIINSAYSQVEALKSGKCELSLPMLEQIEASLKSLNKNTKAKICLLHHHPYHFSNIDYNDTDFIDKGDKLTKILANNGFSIIIHGHKHEPRLIMYNQMAIFASGSFSSLMNLKDVGAENTFHIVTLNVNERKGKIQSWVFGPTSGWRSRHDSYFPCYTGFGSRDLPDNLAMQCNSLYDLKQMPLFYKDIIDLIPNIEFLIPDQQIELAEILKSKYNLEFSPNLPNLPNVLMKRYNGKTGS